MTVVRKDAGKEIERLETLEVICGLDGSQYSKLLALLLISNDLCEAKMVWMRAPEHFKGPDSALSKVRALWRCMWDNDDAAVFKALEATHWPDTLAPLMKSLLLKRKGQNLELISRGYSSIKLAQVAVKLGVSEDVAVQICNQLGWAYEPDTGFVSPKPIPSTHQVSKSTEGHLPQFTQTVSFLEK